MKWSFERVAGPYSFSEGPVWTGDAVLFTDIRNNRIMRYIPSSGSCSTAFNDTAAANGLTLDRLDRLYVCEGGGRRVARYEPDATTTTLADRFEASELNEPTDIVINDPGRIGF